MDSNNVQPLLEKRCGLNKIYNYQGSCENFLINVSQKINPINSSSELVNSIIGEAQRIYGLKNHLLDILKNQLLEYPLISYADHHGLLHYKLLYNSNVLYSQLIQYLQLPYIVVFAAGNVPLCNVSYPRGFYFNQNKFNFFSAKYANIPVYALDKKISANRKKGLASFIVSSSGYAHISKEQIAFLEHLFFECLEIEKASEMFSSFSDQISFLNNKLWKYFFDHRIRQILPDLIYLQANQLIVQQLIKELSDPGSLLSLILFNHEIRTIFLRNYNGIQGCWDNDRGSHFFWGVSPKKKNIRLRFDPVSNALSGEDFYCTLHPDAVIEALRKQEIIPTMMIDFLIVSFLQGFTTLGGFNQIEYLPSMSSALKKSLQEAQLDCSIHKITQSFTEGLVCGMQPISFESGIDLIWHYNSTNGIFNGSLEKGITFSELLDITNMKVKDMILSASKTIAGIIK